jgi:hypothetical protein
VRKDAEFAYPNSLRVSRCRSPTSFPSVLLHRSARLSPSVPPGHCRLGGCRSRINSEGKSWVLNATVQITGARGSRLREQRKQRPNTCAPSTSSKVDADPAAQPSTIQRVQRKPRSRENRYLQQSPQEGATARCRRRRSRRRQGQFQGHLGPDRESCNLHADVYLEKPAAVRWPRG